MDVTNFLLQAGISRSTTAVVSYIMSKDGIGFEDALQEVMRKRPSVAPNRGFCKQLRFLQEESNGQLANYRPEMLQVQYSSSVALSCMVWNQAKTIACDID